MTAGLETRTVMDVPLLMLDLDNTLIDRDRAFRHWAEDYVSARNGSPEDVSWLVGSDRDGYESRESLAELIGQRFGVGDTDAVLVDLRAGMVDRVQLDPAVPASLELARAAGWSLVVVTNGTVTQQERKLRHTGLDRLLDGWVISEEVQVSKPDPHIFRAAADAVGLPLAGSWMIGDSAAHDIIGAQRIGAGSVWLRRGRLWSADDTPPDHTANTLSEAVSFVLDRGGSRWSAAQV